MWRHYLSKHIINLVYKFVKFIKKKFTSSFKGIGSEVVYAKSFELLFQESGKAYIDSKVIVKMFDLLNSSVFNNGCSIEKLTSNSG